MKIAVSMTFPIPKTRILLLAYWHWISTKHCYGNEYNPWPWSMKSIKQTVSVHVWHIVVHRTTEVVKSPTSVAVRLNTIKWHWAVCYRHYTPTISRINNFPTYTAMVPTGAHNYITFSLYTQWTHTCFDQPCVHIQGYKMGNLETLKYPTCYYRCLIFQWNFITQTKIWRRIHKHWNSIFC